jgi:glycosyltransferase involved in cell wall biosynthesis
MYNEKQFIAATIDSLRRQSRQQFEAIIVDDASTDGSMAIAIDAANGDGRFRFARHAVNSGLSAARNTGLRLARAQMITFLDSDDLLFPDALERRSDAIRSLCESEGKQHPPRAFAGVYCRVITMPQNITLEEAERRLPKRDVDCPVVDFVNSGGECPFNAHAPMLFTDIVRAHGGFDETLRHGCEDWDLWQRIMRNGFAFSPTNRLSGIYRRKRGSMVKETPREHLDTAKMLFERARKPVDPDHIVAGAPFVFARALQYYEDSYRFVKRIAQYASINAFGASLAFESTLAGAPPGGSAYIDAELDIRPFVEAGIRRTIAVDEPTIDGLGKEFQSLTQGIVERFAARMAPPACESVARTPVDALFLPQSQAQAKAMAPVARSLIQAGRSVLFITTETETGDQGQNTAIAAEELPSLSFNRAWLLQIQAKVFVLMRPYTGLIRDFVPADACVIEIERANRPVSYPDENQPRTEVTRVAPQDAARAIDERLKDWTPASAEAITVSRSHASACAPFVIAKEESFHQAPDFDEIAALKDKWRGERCIIIGNGPSINQTDLTKLRNEHTFAVNGIFYKAAEMGFDPTFYIVEDSSVMKENIEAIKAYRGQYKLFPTIYRNLHPKEENVLFFLMNRGFYERESPAFCVPRFSTDASRRVYCGQSVTHINLQLAYYFGFSEVYLIGVDFSYVIPESAIRKGDLITSTEDDPNHFHGDYFGKGKTWKDPKLHRVKLNYELARDMFEADGRKVFNATKGGKLEVFERAEYDAIFG